MSVHAAPGDGAAGTGLRVSGGVGGVAARLEDLDLLARALADAAGEAAWLAGSAVRAVADPSLLAAVLTDPAGVARAVADAGQGAGDLCRGAGALAGLAGSVLLAVTAYRAQEDGLAALAAGVPLVLGSLLRARAGAAVVAGVTSTGALPVLVGAAGVVVLAAHAARTAGEEGAAAVPGLPRPRGPVTGPGGGGQAGGRSIGAPSVVAPSVVAPSGGAASAVAGEVREAVVAGVVAHPGLVDGAVRLVPGLVGVVDVPAVARLLGRAGQAGGVLVETPVTVAPVGGALPCSDPSVRPVGGVVATTAGAGSRGRPASGVADLLRRGQGVAGWRVPRAGEHDSLPPGEPRPARGQVRVDRVEGADGAVAWVVHVPGTQDWDGDGEGSPMDMAGNVALVGGSPSAVASGVAAALVGAGARPGQPVAVVGHSQGGMTALDVAADPRLRRVATVTHVVTAGSPVAGREAPPGVQVLAIEHDDDLVPRLDGRSHPDTPDRVVVRAPAPDGPWRTDAVPAHSSSAYVATAAAVDGSHHPSLVRYREGLAPFLDREGASCTTRQVVLARVPAAGGGQP
ncbi:hypothetical protein [Aquipuribacter hungaricus]|uniref:PGAP1-like protein n=1 Tax=Aquipuribacter hungaricus TaxID=545624 RepID=A0ABV7WGV5_9MICO